MNMPIEFELQMRAVPVGQSDRAGQERSYNLVTVNRASEIMSMSESHIRHLADSGQLIALKVGRFWLVHPQLIKIVDSDCTNDTS